MTSAKLDVVIVGLGAMGSAAAWHLAKAGHKVLGIDQFTPPHIFGSSHGQTRIIREAYFEHPAYVPLVQRAYELWHNLEAKTGQRLFQPTGGLMIGPEDGIVFNGARRSAREHGLPHEILNSEMINRRFPAFTTRPGMAAVWEPRAGVLFPEDCIAAHLALAKEAGAQLLFGQRVEGWSSDSDGVHVRTSAGVFTAARMLCTAGAWLPQLVTDLHLPLKVERQVMFWFEAESEPQLFKPGQCPVYIFEDEREHFFYGFPDLGTGIKVARHHEGLQSDPDNLDRDVHANETEGMRDVLRKWLPRANGALRGATVCMYTDTPDGHFIIDWHPRSSRVLLASPCSGHGFKFSSAIGEVLADLLIRGSSRFDMRLFALDRLMGRGSPRAVPG